MGGKAVVDRILMIVSDTVRWDMLGYNGGGVRTPNLDRLAARSMVFDRYYASSFPTVRPAMTTSPENRLSPASAGVRCHAPTARSRPH